MHCSHINWKSWERECIFQSRNFEQTGKVTVFLLNSLNKRLTKILENIAGRVRQKKWKAWVWFTGGMGPPNRVMSIMSPYTALIQTTPWPVVLSIFLSALYWITAPCLTLLLNNSCSPWPYYPMDVTCIPERDSQVLIVCNVMEDCIVFSLNEGHWATIPRKHFHSSGIWGQIVLFLNEVMVIPFKSGIVTGCIVKTNLKKEFDKSNSCLKSL